MLPRRGSQRSGEKHKTDRVEQRGWGAPCGVVDLDVVGEGGARCRGPQVTLSACVDLRGLLVGHGRPVAEEPVARAIDAVGAAALGRAKPREDVALGVGGLRPYAEGVALRHGEREEQRAVPTLNVEGRGPGVH
eukprot:COSAG06_NODE_11077_length_1571_cov_36.725749_3_plen_133_part_01